MGASLAYFVVMPTAFHFFLEFQGNSSGLQVEALPSADSYLGLVMQFILARSEEHTSELQSLMRISYAVFCLKKKKQKTMMTRRHYRTTMATNRQHTAES